MIPIDVVIPARNEEGTVLPILYAFRAHPQIRQIVLVVDADTQDNTYDKVRQYIHDAEKNNIRVLVGPAGGGKGQNVQAGLLYVRTRRVIFCDADIIGLTNQHIDRLAKSYPHQLQTILVPKFPANVPEHVTNAWPWVSGQRCVTTSFITDLDLHGYLMEVQINRKIESFSNPQHVPRTGFLFTDDLVSPYKMTSRRLEEMERDRRWGIEHGVLQ
jgi:glycosyltransferase involved in cell wall biosynthesis